MPNIPQKQVSSGSEQAMVTTVALLTAALIVGVRQARARNTLSRMSKLRQSQARTPNSTNGAVSSAGLDQIDLLARVTLKPIRFSTCGKKKSFGAAHRY